MASPTGQLSGDVEYFNVGKEQYGVCREHRTFWMLGMNLMSSRRHETVAHWKASVRSVDGYYDVDDGETRVVGDDIDSWELWSIYR